MTPSTTSMTAAPADRRDLKARQQRMWAAGDYAAVGATFQIIGEELCEAAELRPGWRVLDVATGSGGTALAAARRGCDVTGVDYVPALLDRARDRAAAERYAIAFDEGDAEQLLYDDAAFDATLSSLGVMFAADHRRAAAELLRVTTPGGVIALANWAPTGFIGRVFDTMDAHVPPPPGAESSGRWGTTEYVRELFGDGVGELRFATRQFVFRYRSPEHLLTFLRDNCGPTLTAFEMLDSDGRDALAADLRGLMTSMNRGDGTLAIPADYLEVVATRAR